MTRSAPSLRIAVIGLGLIGGSICKAARTAGCVNHILGYDADPGVLRDALQAGVVDAVADSVPDAVGDADLVALAVPMLAVSDILREVGAGAGPSTVITDAGSVKQSVVEAGGDQLPDALRRRLVPGHPIAGSEQTGLEAARADLYRNARVILTPPEDVDADALERVESFWTALGARVETMDARHHDEVLALTSHLPHLLAYTLVDALAGQESNQEIFRYAAGGFRDFTRIASSDPLMWHDIFSANRDNVLRALDLFAGSLGNLRTAIETGDGTAMLGIFTRAKSARDHFLRMLEGRVWMDRRGEAGDTFVTEPGGSLRGEVRVPGDKSVSHRSIMLGSIAEGVTEVYGFLEGEDSLATLQAFRDMGVVIEGPSHGHVVVHGVGMQGLKAAPGPLYLGNSGTSMRLLAGLLAAQAFDTEMTGDASLSRRPMKRVTEPLARMGAKIETTEGGTPPLRVTGSRKLKGIRYEMPVASAQVKSALLLAGLYAEGETTVIEPAPTRDHTERMLSGLGYAVRRDDSAVSLAGGGRLAGTRIEVPADISSAAFFMVAASIAADSEIVLTHVGINPTRIGVINILRAMGGDIRLENERLAGGEPVADVRVRHAQLRGIEIAEDQVPLAIDEFPVLFVAAACASGETVLRGAEELRVKESDRIQVMADGLNILGVDAQPTPDGMRIRGGPIGGGEVHSHGDHRIAMAFAVAGLRATAPITIRDCANVATSFPGFIGLARGAGFRIHAEDKP